MVDFEIHKGPKKIFFKFYRKPSDNWFWGGTAYDILCKEGCMGLWDLTTNQPPINSPISKCWSISVYKLSEHVFLLDHNTLEYRCKGICVYTDISDDYKQQNLKFVSYGPQKVIGWRENNCLGGSSLRKLLMCYLFPLMSL